MQNLQGQHKKLGNHWETALQGALVSAKSGEWDRDTIFCGHYRSIFNHCDIIGQQSYQILWKKKQNKCYYAVQGHRGRYQWKARMRLPITD